MDEVGGTKLSECRCHWQRISFPNIFQMANEEEIIITKHGKSAGLLIGFASEEDWFDYRLENDPHFLKWIAEARDSLYQGKGVRIEDLP